MQDLLWANAVAIQQLSDAIDHLGACVSAHDAAIRAPHRALMEFRCEAAIGVLKMIVREVSLGGGGGAVDTVFAAIVASAVNFSDSDAAQPLLEMADGVGFNAVAILGSASADDAEELFFSGLDEWAVSKGDDALDDATSSHITIRLLVVVAAVAAPLRPCEPVSVPPGC